MPNPLSETFRVSGIYDFEPITKKAISVKNPQDKELDKRSRLNAKNFLDGAINSLPTFGSLREYNLTPDSSEGGKQMAIGPTGLRLSESEEGSNRPKWSLELNPWMGGGSFRAGDFQIGGTAGFSPSAFISKGPFRFDAGYGAPPIPYAEGTQSTVSGPENWAKLSVNLQPERAAGTPAEVSVRQAVSPFVTTREESKPKTAREEADELISKFRQTNADWHRP